MGIVSILPILESMEELTFASVVSSLSVEEKFKLVEVPSREQPK